MTRRMHILPFSLSVLLSASVLAGVAGAHGAAGPGQKKPMQLTSDVLADGDAIPARFTCDGANRSPPLRWSAPPTGTQSFALIVDDPDAPHGIFHHWGIFDLPAAMRDIPEGVAKDYARQARNDFGKIGYGGPCPPKGHGPHRYRFKLFALDVPHLTLGSDPKITDIERAISGHALASATLVTHYKR